MRSLKNCTVLGFSALYKNIIVALVKKFHDCWLWQKSNYDHTKREYIRHLCENVGLFSVLGEKSSNTLQFLQFPSFFMQINFVVARAHFNATIFLIKLKRLRQEEYIFLDSSSALQKLFSSPNYVFPPFPKNLSTYILVNATKNLFLPQPILNLFF